ncbi:glycosyltransferase [Paenibacillus chartarius]|uniref:Glycosyltransferase n=1 Tax=Paenibacillus chartarius TaxID=747481 RepID=A0ABV6DJU8_9BACL
MTKLLSLCMIVKNEEKTLARCLDSVKAIADEMIIIDTGSTDQTKAIALQYTTHVYDFEWINDFAAAKNDAIRRATGKWILVLDADEYLKPGQEDHFRQLLENYEVRKPIGVMLKIMNYLGETEQNISGVLESSAARLFPNGQGIHFERPIHEQLACSKGKLELLSTSLTILHTGYIRTIVNEKKKSNRNMEIFKQLQSNDPYDCYTLGNEYLSMNDCKKAQYYYGKAMRKMKPTLIWAPYCYDGYIHASLQLTHLREAHTAIKEALDFWPEYADFSFLLGHLYMAAGFAELAEAQLKTCIEQALSREKRKLPSTLVKLDYASYLPHKYLAQIYMIRHDWSQAVYHLSGALKSNNSDLQLLTKLLTILKGSEEASEIINMLDRLYSGNAEHSAYLLRVSCRVGIADLAAHYYNRCAKKEIPLGQLDHMHVALLLGDRELFKNHYHLPAPDSVINDYNMLLTLAYLVWKESDFLNKLLDKQPAHPMLLFLRNEEQSLQSVDAPYLEGILKELFQLGYHQEYESLISLVQSPEAINSLANFFYEQRQFELAVDYYAVLLEHQILDAQGYENLAYLYISLGEIGQALAFIEQAIELAPEHVALYVLYCTHSTDPQKRNAMKSKLLNRAPHFRSLPFVRDL